MLWGLKIKVVSLNGVGKTMKEEVVSVLKDYFLFDPQDGTLLEAMVLFCPFKIFSEKNCNNSDQFCNVASYHFCT